MISEDEGTGKVIIEGIIAYAPKNAFKGEHYPVEAFRAYAELEAEHFWFKTRARLIADLMSRYSNKSSQNLKLLEIGCGTGFLADYLSKTIKINILATDIHIEGLQLAKNRNPELDLRQMDATDIPFLEQFDNVGIFDVLEHIPNHEKVLREIYRSLKPSGLLFISVPQYMWMWSDHDVAAKHERRYTKKELQNLLSASGFDVERATSFVCLLFPLMIISRYLRKFSSKTNAATDVSSEYGELNLNKVVNRILTFVNLVEVYLVKFNLNMPFGGSLVMIARKK